MRKAVLILFVLFAAQTFLSCCKSEVNFRWTKAVLTNVSYATLPVQETRADSSRFHDYGFRLRFNTELISSLSPSLGLNAAYALSCQRFYFNKDTAIAVDVITQNNFDNSHAAGSSLNDILLARPTYGASDTMQNPFLPLAQVVPMINRSGSFGGDVDFRFRPSSPFPGTQRFQINVTTASGRRLVNSTQIRFY